MSRSEHRAAASLRSPQPRWRPRSRGTRSRAAAARGAASLPSTARGASPLEEGRSSRNSPAPRSATSPRAGYFGLYEVLLDDQLIYTDAKAN